MERNPLTGEERRLGANGNLGQNRSSGQKSPEQPKRRKVPGSRWSISVRLVWREHPGPPVDRLWRNLRCMPSCVRQHRFALRSWPFRKPLPALIQQELSPVRIAIPPACSDRGEIVPSAPVSLDPWQVRSKTYHRRLVSGTILLVWPCWRSPRCVPPTAPPRRRLERTRTWVERACG